MPSLLLSLTCRSPDEHHRVSTTLELFLDLAIVIAIASAAAGLHHAIAENHAAEGVLTFALAFFGIWWAWMGYTWFASAFDDGSLGFRLATLVVIGGALITAAGIAMLVESREIGLVVAGYVVMRGTMIWLWLCVAKGAPEYRKTALRYAGGIAVAQAFWCAFALTIGAASPLFLPAFALGVLLELTVPYRAERAGTTPWHRHHMIERYGLLNIIVLGESLLAVALALRAGSTGHGFDMALAGLALAAFVITCAMWWLYFSAEDHLDNRDHSRAFAWGYGHVMIFAGGAATGAGFAVGVDVVTHHAKAPALLAAAAIAVPLALYLLALWFVRDRYLTRNRLVLPLAAVAVLTTVVLPFAAEAMAVVMVGAAVLRGRGIA